MISSPPRVLVGRLYHESNRLNPSPTAEDGFIIDVGDSMFGTSGSVLQGLVDALRRHAVSILPALSIAGPPAGLVDHAAYIRFRTAFLNSVAELKPDAIVLDLHGAMGTTQVPDAEGDFLAALRRLVGPDVPIGIGLDLHAHLTDAMLDNTDVCVACKENPHSDTVECGERVAELILARLAGRIHPVTVSARVPMVLPGAAETAQGPLAEIHELARRHAAADPSILDISIYNVFRFTDDDTIGQVVTVTTDGPSPRAGSIAVDLAGQFWLNRHRFKDDLLTVEAFFETVSQRPHDRPFAVGDMGDRVLAGAPGDSVILLSAALDHYPGLRGAVTVTDPQAADAAVRAGVGATVTLDVGGRITPGFAPRTVTGEVTHISDGRFALAGPFKGGEPCDMGATAVMRVDQRLWIVLTSRPAYSHDPAAFTSQAVPIDAVDFIVVKSGYHFMINFAGKATPLLVATPGVGYYMPGLSRYERARFWPEHDIGEPRITAKSHPRDQIIANAGASA